MDASLLLLEVEVDIFGQQPDLNIYTQIALLYPLEDDSTPVRDAIESKFNIGLQRLADAFPWTAGQVVCEGGSDGETGTFKIKPLAGTPSMVVRHHDSDPTVPTFLELREASFPFRMLDESKIAPRRTIPGTAGEDLPTTSPCFLMQVNFVKGGLILVFNAQHQTMDAVGQETVMRMLTKACRGDVFTEEELRVGNMTRKDLVPLLDTKNGQLLSLDLPPAAPATDSSADSTGQSAPRWASFAFSAESQNALKQHATATKPESCKFVSTDDALTAFTWQSVSRARLHRHTPDTPCKTMRAVDVRRYLGIPPTYPGMMQNMTYHCSTLGAISRAPLGQIAAEMRFAVDPETTKLVEKTRAWLTVSSQTKDKRTISFAANFNLDIDIMLSSWMKVESGDMDFGLGLGPPVAIRRPQFIPFGGLGYMLPKAKDRETVLGICLKEVDLDNLRRDEEFLKYARYIP